MYDDIWDYEHESSDNKDDKNNNDSRDDKNNSDNRDDRNDSDNRDDRIDRIDRADIGSGKEGDRADRYRDSMEDAAGENRYRSTQSTYQVNRNYIPEEPAAPKKKKRPMAAKIAGITAAAVLFGSVAGVTMFGVNLAAGKLTGIYPTVRQSETLAENSASAVGNEENSEGVVSVAAPYMDVSAIVKKAMPSVVAITNKQVYQSNNWFFGPSQYEGQSSGSGIIIGQNENELLIVTNNHVVEGSTELKVTFIDEVTVDAAIKGTDSESDLAVIAIQKKNIPEETLAQITVAAIGASDDLEPGQGVVAIGNALGYGQSTTVGYISALNREVKSKDPSTGEITTRTMIQVDAAINPGNSGGALLNMKGEVIGINAAKYSSTDVEGIGYAIPITFAENIIGDLINRQTRIVVDESKQGYLGIQGQNITYEMAQAFGMPRGVYVYKILEGGAASESSLKEKDIITKIDGTSVRSMADLQEMLTYFEGGSTVSLTVQSLVDGQYQENTIEIKLGYRTDAQKMLEENAKQDAE